MNEYFWEHERAGLSLQAKGFKYFFLKGEQVLSTALLTLLLL